MITRKLARAGLGLGLFLAISAAILGLAWGLSLSREMAHELKRVERLKDEAVALSTEVFDRRGEKIGEFSEERRYHVRLSELPKHVPQAFLAIEDKDFYDHFGIDLFAIARSAVANLRGGGIRQGASTITQQLARLYFLDQSRSWTRKLKEAMLAVVIERHLSKDDILELYLNKIFLGNRSYGLEAAARNYFRKNARELSVGEAALLAGLPKAPTKYAPNKYPDRADKRQELVLKRMAADGYITAGDAKAWAKLPVHVAPKPEDHASKAPFFIAAVQREMMRKFELDELPRDGLRIYTTLDGRLQRAAASALAGRLKAVRKDAIHTASLKGRIEGAIVSVDPRSGAVLALQGGSSFAQTQFNRAESARRRLGRLFMPVFLSLALERGHTLTSPVGTDPMGGARRAAAQGPEAPSLYDVAVKGLTMEASRVFASLGAGSVLAHAKRLGLELGREDLMVALGYGEATPMEAALTYGAFLNGGRLVTPYFISRIEDRDGKVLYAAKRDPGAEAMTPATAYIMNQLLRDAVEGPDAHASGAAGVSKLTAGMSAATDDLHNAWFAGGLPSIATAAWIGAETGQARLAADEEVAADVAETLWRDYMRAAPSTYVNEAEPLRAPGGVSFARVGGRSLPFLAGTEPRTAGGETVRF